MSFDINGIKPGLMGQVWF